MICMYLDAPGEYLFEDGTVVQNEELIAEAGFDVKADRKAGLKAVKLAEAKAKIEADFADAEEKADAEAEAEASAEVEDEVVKLGKTRDPGLYVKHKGRGVYSVVDELDVEHAEGLTKESAHAMVAESQGQG
jgi:hypothetical protein